MYYQAYDSLFFDLFIMEVPQELVMFEWIQLETTFQIKKIIRFEYIYIPI